MGHKNVCEEITAKIFQNLMEDNMLPDAKQNKHKEGHTEAPPGQKVKSPRS